jgi:hypothetical protein
MSSLNSVGTDRMDGLQVHTTLYQIEALPDCEDPVYRLMAGGDVRRAIGECHELLLRSLVTHVAASAALAVHFAFTPATEPSRRQSRLAITIQVSATDEETAQTLRLLVECSDLAVYYGLRKVQAMDVPHLVSCAEYHITRAEHAVRPLHPPDGNPAIPPLYYGCHPFTQRSDSDGYRGLDRILDRLTEPVLIDMAVTPADVTEERFLHSRYMARLQLVNRFSGYEDEDSAAGDDPFEPDRHIRSGRSSVIRPLRRRDPIADDVLHAQRRFHETLNQPHLAFRMTVTAHTPAVAKLVAASMAESAFQEGSYRLWPHRAGPGRSPLDFSRDVSTLDRVLGEHATAYHGFSRLAHIATVDELLGAFALPVASRSESRCIRKNTEPPIVPREQLLVFGHDE